MWILSFMARNQMGRLIFRQLSYGIPKQKIKLFGLEFGSQFGIGAGIDLDGRGMPVLQYLGSGFVIAGPVSLHGNPRTKQLSPLRIPAEHAIAHSEMGYIASLGEFRRHRKHHDAIEIPLGIAIADPKPILVMEEMSTYADFFTVVATPGMSLCDVRNATTKPILLRLDLGIKQSKILDKALEAQREAWDGIVIGNGRPYVAMPQGRIDSQEDLEQLLRLIKLLRKELGDAYPIVAAGGIITPEDAVECIQNGASLVEFMAGLVYSGPGVIERALTLAAQHPFQVGEAEEADEESTEKATEKPTDKITGKSTEEAIEKPTDEAIEQFPERAAQKIAHETPEEPPKEVPEESTEEPTDETPKGEEDPTSKIKTTLPILWLKVFGMLTFAIAAMLAIFEFGNLRLLFLGDQDFILSPMAWTNPIETIWILTDLALHLFLLVYLLKAGNLSASWFAVFTVGLLALYSPIMGAIGLGTLLIAEILSKGWLIYSFRDLFEKAVPAWIWSAAHLGKRSLQFSFLILLFTTFATNLPSQLQLPIAGTMALGFFIATQAIRPGLAKLWYGFAGMLLLACGLFTYLTVINAIANYAPLFVAFFFAVIGLLWLRGPLLNLDPKLEKFPDV
jgi:dihydroorotate dehydrogenase